MGGPRPRFPLTMALGAPRREIIGGVLRSGLTMMAMGLAIGLVGVAAIGRVLASQLYDVRSTDPLALAGTVVVVVVMAVAASLIPAWRAVGVQPTTALRSE